ncbi:MAG: ABC transporter ATP-binding protein, partial [Clostridiales bacterium]|nr:ABC transporter ATP-binding protein [Clostridiales bacterium]
LLINVGIAMLVLVGAYQVNAGSAKVGAIISSTSYMTMILNALMMVSRLFAIYTRGAASAKRIAEVLDAPDDMPLSPRDHEDTEYHLAFRDVRFSYDGVQDNLAGVSFALRRGQTLGVIGPTGSGKSTLISLLMRLYDVGSGEIRISGDNVAGIPPAELHTMFGVAFQNDFLFADTIRENIDLGRGLSDEAIERAARAAQADFIWDNEAGMEYDLAVKGANLSGGQKQRLLIARALAGNPQVLILDDSSSALDYRTDAKLRRALREEYAQVTTVIVAQRVSSLLHADAILVLDEGEAIGYGTHEQLMATCDSYRELYEVQMGEVA